jgi:hypothetical protein
MRVCLRPFEGCIFVHDLFFRYMHVPRQLIFKHELCQELTINFQLKLVEAFFFDNAISAEEWRNFEANHGIAVMRESLKGKLDGLVAMSRGCTTVATCSGCLIAGTTCLRPQRTSYRRHHGHLRCEGVSVRIIGV